MDVAVVLRGKSMRCLTGDMATDSVVEAWVMIYWGIYMGTTWAPPPWAPMGCGVNLGHHDLVV